MPEIEKQLLCQKITSFACTIPVLIILALFTYSYWGMSSEAETFDAKLSITDQERNSLNYDDCGGIRDYDGQLVSTNWKTLFKFKSIYYLSASLFTVLIFSLAVFVPWQCCRALAVPLCVVNGVVAIPLHFLMNDSNGSTNLSDYCRANGDEIFKEHGEKMMTLLYCEIPFALVYPIVTIFAALSIQNVHKLS